MTNFMIGPAIGSVVLQRGVGAPFPDAVTAGQWTVTESGVTAGKAVISVDAGVSVPSGFELRLYFGVEVGGGSDAQFAAGAIITPGTPYETNSTFSPGSTRYGQLAWRRISGSAIDGRSDVKTLTFASGGGLSWADASYNFGAAA